MIAKFILPWYGGSAAVWTTCMMFFQVVLLMGYLYSHFLRRQLSPRNGLWVHGILLVLSMAVLRQQPPEFLRPTGGENLTWAIVQLLAFTVGLPFFVLSSTGPLVQAWHSRSHGKRSKNTYRFYALSNLGSMLALISYPFVFEPLLKLQTQTWSWSIGFVCFAFLCFWSGLQIRGFADWGAIANRVGPKEVDDIPSGLNGVEKPPLLDCVLWTGLAMAPSVLLLAVTNLMCQEVASIPFLWILPLVIYLASLIVCFDRPSLYWRRIYWPLTIVFVIGGVLLMHVSNQASLLVQVVGFSTGFFVWCMTCHGELERIKPSTQHLTLFYLLVSVGGALGGIFVVVVAPRIFLDYCEYHVGLLMCLGIPAFIRVREAYQQDVKSIPVFSTWSSVLGALVAAGCIACSLIYFLAPMDSERMLGRIRNEYGLVYVRDKSADYRIMVNGRTEHGGQYLDTERELIPNGYYTDGCGPSVAVKAMRGWLASQKIDRPMKYGVLGLGTGSLVTWGKLEDQFTFYEINPASEVLARKYFTYLDRWGSNARVILGDGRIQLQRQLDTEGSQQFDLLFLDAFTSDSIPAHLITVESFDLYMAHLKADGILVAHITNRFVDLRGVVKGLADNAGLSAVYLEDFDNSTDWVIMSRNERVLNQPSILEVGSEWPMDMQPIVWTDNFYSLAQVVDWSFRFQWQNRSQNGEAEPN